MKTIDVIVKKKSERNEESSLFTAALAHAISRLSVIFSFTFPENLILNLRQKMKDDFS